MKPKINLMYVLFALFIPIMFHVNILYAENQKITIAIGLALPPYNIPETNSGMEYEIVKEALAIKGYELVPKYVPFARRNIELQKKTVDGVMTITEKSGINAFYTNSHITYENIVVSLKSKNMTVNSIKDLSDKSIKAFQDATVYLGEEYAAMSKSNPQYSEIANQEIQLNVLFTGRVDVIVIDKNIFSYYKTKIKKVDTSQQVTIHKIFSPSPYSIAFIDKKIRDDFNEGLKQLRSSGRYEKIQKKYVAQLL